MLTETRTFSATPRSRAVRWVFLDRDGTLNVKPPTGDYIEHPGALELLPGAAEAVRTLNHAGLWTGVVTNQRGVALGRMSSQDLEAVHERLERLLRLEGAYVDAIYSCPHEVGECVCRKPDTGLLLKAQSEHPKLDFASAAIVGDSVSDVQAGERLGLLTVMISGGEHDCESYSADYVVPDLAQAARLLATER